MVKKKGRNMLRKNLNRTVARSFGRFLAIVLIIALGAGLFVGLLTTKTDMLETCQWYTDRQNMFDLHLLNTYGWTESDVDAVRQMEPIADAEGTVALDVLLQRDGDEQTSVYRVMGIPERINCVELQSGRMPQSPDECLIDGAHGGASAIGSVFTVADTNESDTLEALSLRTYTVVGSVSSPLYLNVERGNTSLGSGRISSYLYVMPETFQTDYYTDIYATIPGDYRVYTQAYDDAMDAAAEAVKPLLTPLASSRMETVRQQAEEAYADGLEEYRQGVEDYESGKAQAQKELGEARKKLEDGQKELDAQKTELEKGRQQLEDGQKQIDEGNAQLVDSRQQLADSQQQTYNQLGEAQAELLANYKTVKENLAQAESGLAQIQTGLSALDSGIAQIDSGLEQIDSGVEQLDLLISILNPTLEAARKALEYAQSRPETDQAYLEQLQARLEELEKKRDEYEAQKDTLTEQRDAYAAQREELVQQREQLTEKQEELLAAQEQLNAAKEQIDTGFLELQTNQTQAENQFAAAQSQLDAAKLNLENSQKTLDEKKAELEAGETALEQAQQELTDGWQTYTEEKEKSDRALADAEAKLESGRQELADARERIDTLSEPSVYALTRNTNVGYVSMQSDSDIVAGVSRVFPAFFLLVAALVCITTMTRMVNEERTQIGTFKALGYGSAAIIGKYLAYSGIGAVLGCGLGVLVGSVAFPQIIWQGYRILYNIRPWLRMKVDWPLCAAVVSIYTAVILLVSWYCCRRELREVPAELIRPRAPTSGKKIFLEHIGLWNRLSFLNKVAVRNIFRYRQRLLMMLLGIGGCTALLVTGFGIRDSIFPIVDYQFEEVTVYDLSVTFQREQSEEEQTKFREALQGKIDKLLFCHESSVELDTGDGVKEVYLLASDDRLTDFVDLHRGSQALEMPGLGEALLSCGAAESMGIRVGDRITLRSSDMQTMELTVGGIFDNNVYNYVIVPYQTARLAWGEDCGMQTALITTREDQDVHAASASILDMSGVMNVTVSQDLANQVDSMMDAMNLIVATVVFCAALLAVIVVYNLTNININERVREIATIKVLGFRAGETAAYVFKENLALSVMGALLGLVGGKFLLDFVMSQIRLDMVWFTARVSLGSYLLSVAMTLLAACAVDLVFYFRLERINMAEALKSVE